ncbi:PREDICTED: uncharacterized protein LOC108759992 [Trachymyrmex cornetzi]|uniref:uncharacterized protein LOC108759992 n=1 Tax=Trachymyrmex cornetzi TaxID=471704 RepID=UPI00084F3907|nr:PREDICTED: uncharacterized protein LOC108759992 [Trachymyrmex cornetzi]
MDYQLIATSSFLIACHQHLILQWKQRKQRERGHGRRRWWVRPINRNKDEQGFLLNLIREMEIQDHEKFYRTFRMWPEQFNWLLDQVQDKLQKRSRRTPLDPKLRLQVTLLYLAQGDSILSKHNEFRIGRSTAHKIIPETCQAIWETLQPIFLPPMDRNSWNEVANRFMEKWQFPNCLGAIDGKHIRIKAPPMSGSKFFNYKKFFSIVLMAACYAEYKFTWVDIGQYGSVSDGGVWNNTDFAQDLEAGEVNLPPPSSLPGTDVPFPYVFVADEAFPLRNYLMRPFPKKNERMSDEERIFNYRLSRARRTIENAFAILTIKWEILLSCLSCSPEHAEQIVKAIICLHNFLITCSRSEYCPQFRNTEHNDEIETRISQSLFYNLGRVGANRSSRVANGMRNYLKQYFVSEIGQEQAPW